MSWRGFKQVVKRSRAITLGAWLAKDAIFATRQRLGRDSGMHIGARHRGWSLSESLAYIDWVVGDYRRYAGLDAAAVAGKRVLEVGPGDNYGVALELIGDGAEQVVCLDRFHNWRDPDQQAAIYAAQVERADGDRRERMQAAIADDQGGFDPARIRAVEGVTIEEAVGVLDERFGVIISRAVLLQVWDLDGALEAMDALLEPGGVQAHKVDLSDNGLLTTGGHNPLEFLTISDAVWDRMRRHTGLMNREMIDSYREGMGARGYDAELPVTRVRGDDEELDPHHAPLTAEEMARAKPHIDAIRDRLLPRYRALDDADLAADGIFLVARKRPS